MAVKGVANRRFKDPNKLTPYEERLWKQHKLGLNLRQIADTLGYKNTEGVRSRLILIKDKLACANANEAVHD